MDVLKQKIKVRVQVHSIETVDKLLLEKSAARCRCRNFPSTSRCSTHVIMNLKWKIMEVEIPAIDTVESSEYLLREW